MPLLVKELEIMQNEGKKVMIVFPDEGANKRFKTDLEQWPAVTCVKVRNGEKRNVTIKDGTHLFLSITDSYSLYHTGNAEGNDVVIVDDLVQTGGTIMECAKVEYHYCHHYHHHHRVSIYSY